MEQLLKPHLDPSFRLANIFAMSGWFILIFLPFWQFGPKLVIYGSFVLLAFTYAYLLRHAMQVKPEPGEDKPNFTTLPGVLALLKNPEGAVTAWVHFLAFDLMIGYYINQQGQILGVSHWLLVPCYLLTLQVV